MQKLELEHLKDKQRDAITGFMEGKNVFVSLPTGLLSYAFDTVRGKSN